MNERLAARLRLAAPVSWMTLIFWSSSRAWPGAESSVAAETFHEFALQPNLIPPNGRLVIAVHNPNPVAMTFAPADGIEILYREGKIGRAHV